jgi:hypothetical protein
MRLQDVETLANDIAHVTLRPNEAGEWEVSISLGEGAISQEHKITKYWDKDEPRSWKSLDKAVKTLQETLKVRFARIDIPLKKTTHEKASTGSS